MSKLFGVDVRYNPVGLGRGRGRFTGRWTVVHRGAGTEAVVDSYDAGVGQSGGRGQMNGKEST